MFEIISKSPIENFNDVKEEIINRSLELIGQLGVAKAGMQVMADCWNKEKQRGIIRVGHKSVDEIKAALTFIETINNQKVIVKSVGVSGVINKAKKKYLC